MADGITGRPRTSRMPDASTATPMAAPSPFRPPTGRTAVGAMGGGLVLFLLIAADVHFRGGMTRIDHEVATWVYDSIPPATRDWFRHVASAPGDARWILPVVVIASTAIALLGRWRTAAVVLMSAGLERLAVWTLKDFFAVERPLAVIAKGDVAGLSASFPSGHTVGATVGVGLVFYFLTYVYVSRTRRDPAPIVRVLVGAWVLMALAMGSFRVLAGLHWPTDVLAGWALGVSWLALTILVHEAWVRPFEQLANGRRPTNEAIL